MWPNRPDLAARNESNSPKSIHIVLPFHRAARDCWDCSVKLLGAPRLGLCELLRYSRSRLRPSREGLIRQYRYGIGADRLAFAIPAPVELERAREPRIGLNAVIGVEIGLERRPIDLISRNRLTVAILWTPCRDTKLVSKLE